MAATEDGIIGEQKLFKLLGEHGYKFFQADAIGEKDDKFFVFEAKHQERFKAPPFDGHGLPRWQVEARLSFEDKTGIGTMFVVFDKETNEIFVQNLRVLDEGLYHDTHGLKPRRIYPITSFKNIK